MLQFMGHKQSDMTEQLSKNNSVIQSVRIFVYFTFQVNILNMLNFKNYPKKEVIYPHELH